MTKTLCSGDVYEECPFIEIFIESLDNLIRHSVRELWKNMSGTNLHNPRSTLHPYSGYKDTICCSNELARLGRNIQKNAETLVFLQEMRKCDAEWIKIMPIGFYREHFGYAILDIAPHYISLYVRIVCVRRSYLLRGKVSTHAPRESCQKVVDDLLSSG